MQLKFLNNKEVKAIASIVKNQWGAQLPQDYFFILRKDGDLFLVNRSIEKLDLSPLRINSLGLYIGELRNNELRLSIEGSQLIGPTAAKNVIKINKTQLSQWLRGEDFDIGDMENIGSSCYVILKHQKDFVGCGKISNGNVLNFVPKTRRIRVVNQ
jgi:NOL1/NOP2/fmu family ribosome biogenesis protein